MSRVASQSDIGNCTILGGPLADWIKIFGSDWWVDGVVFHFHYILYVLLDARIVYVDSRMLFREKTITDRNVLSQGCDVKDTCIVTRVNDVFKSQQ